MGLICVLLLTGCANYYYPPRPIEPEITKSFEVDASFDRTWEALIETFAELQLPIKTIEKDSGIIATEWINYGRVGYGFWAKCGGVDRAVGGRDPFYENPLLGQFNVFVNRTGETRLTINSMWKVVVNGTDYDCLSLGTLEALADSLVVRHLKRRQ